MEDLKFCHFFRTYFYKVNVAMNLYSYDPLKFALVVVVQ